MASGKHQHLRLAPFDHETGEICPGCVERDAEIAALETEKRSWRVKYQQLARDKLIEARAHLLYPIAGALFTEWKVATNHLKSRWTADRFWLCEPYLTSDGYVECRWAVWGIAYLPPTKQIGDYVERYDSWELCFRNRGNFERYVNRGHASPEAREQFERREREDDDEAGGDDAARGDRDGASSPDRRLGLLAFE